MLDLAYNKITNKGAQYLDSVLKKNTVSQIQFIFNIII